MVWHEARADEDFWHEHFFADSTAERLEPRRKESLSESDEGRLLEAVVPKVGRVIEAGCGAGRWLAVLHTHGYDVEGIDSSEPLVARLNDVAPDLRVRVGDALAIDVPDGYYQCYLCFGVIEHRIEGPEPFLAEAFRVLDHGGVAYITVPAVGPIRRLRARLHGYRADPGDLPFYQYGFRPAELRSLVSDAGFVVESITMTEAWRLLSEELPFLRPMVFRRGGELIKRVLVRLVGNRDGHLLALTARKP